VFPPDNPEDPEDPYISDVQFQYVSAQTAATPEEDDSYLTEAVWPAVPNAISYNSSLSNNGLSWLAFAILNDFVADSAHPTPYRLLGDSYANSPLGALLGPTTPGGEQRIRVRPVFPDKIGDWVVGVGSIGIPADAEVYIQQICVYNPSIPPHNTDGDGNAVFPIRVSWPHNVGIRKYKAQFRHLDGGITTWTTFYDQGNATVDGQVGSVPKATQSALCGTGDFKYGETLDLRVAVYLDDTTIGEWFEVVDISVPTAQSSQVCTTSPSTGGIFTNFKFERYLYRPGPSTPPDYFHPLIAPAALAQYWTNELTYQTRASWLYYDDPNTHQYEYHYSEDGGTTWTPTSVFDATGVGNTEFVNLGDTKRPDFVFRLRALDTNGVPITPWETLSGAIGYLGEQEYATNPITAFEHASITDKTYTEHPIGNIPSTVENSDIATINFTGGFPDGIRHVQIEWRCPNHANPALRDWQAPYTFSPLPPKLPYQPLLQSLVDYFSDYIEYRVQMYKGDIEGFSEFSDYQVLLPWTNAFGSWIYNVALDGAATPTPTEWTDDGVFTWGIVPPHQANAPVADSTGSVRFNAALNLTGFKVKVIHDRDSANDMSWVKVRLNGTVLQQSLSTPNSNPNFWPLDGSGNSFFILTIAGLALSDGANSVEIEGYMENTSPLPQTTWIDVVVYDPTFS
jgi:hypothetical protein